MGTPIFLLFLLLSGWENLYRVRGKRGHAEDTFNKYKNFKNK